MRMGVSIRSAAFPALVLVTGVVLVHGCDQRKGKPVPGAEPPTAQAAMPSSESKTPAAVGAEDAYGDEAVKVPYAGVDADQSDILKNIRAGIISELEPVGVTSVVLHVKMRGTTDAAFKPRQTLKPLGYRAEIGAYRVARLLGLDNVPPAISRSILVSTLRDKLSPDAKANADAFIAAMVPEGLDKDQTVPGVVTYWIPQLRELGLDSTRRMERWTRHLQQGGSIHDEELAWHRDIANTLLFDYLIGNIDRWSGGNVRGTPKGDRIYIRDHDLAFPEVFRAPRNGDLLAQLGRTQKFSRGVVRRLAAMTEASLRAELALDPRSAVEPILSDAQIAGVLDRRDAILSYVKALVDQYGEDKVLVFE